MSIVYTMLDKLPVKFIGGDIKWKYVRSYKALSE